MSSLIWLIALFVLVGQARLASATCGDYLSTSRHAIELVNEQSAVPHETLPQPGTRIPVCTGPGCRPYHPIPNQPIATTMSLEAILLPGLRPIPPLAQLFRHDDPTIQVRGPAARIFRPPRAICA